MPVPHKAPLKCFAFLILGFIDFYGQKKSLDLQASPSLL